MNINEMVKSPGEWMRGTGPEAEIVISSRIRLARNLADFTRAYPTLQSGAAR